ncbi:unnamed protein product [Cuscuta epithymum]|uniref:Transposase Tnp1/En/Spm-like domain-containing protein n=1 Tax=Cuscuta epithymum TaxID=186058 RepID=A0AAV0C6X9_9ASTE|nr:unnamed protein product [Cuscuta epithymum]
MLCMKQAVGKTIAWPVDKVVRQITQNSENEDNTSLNMGTNMSHIRCTIFNWAGKDEIVAQGYWISSDPKMIVNGIPLGPKAMIVWIDDIIKPECFLWRPTLDMTSIKDVSGTKIAWPSDKVVLENISNHINLQSANKSSSSQSINNSKKKCNLLDISGSGKIVAEGHWSSSDPNQLVHFVPLGPNAMRVWVDMPRIPDALLWRPTSELECIEDAVGTTIAWPSNKVVML